MEERTPSRPRSEPLTNGVVPSQDGALLRALLVWAAGATLIAASGIVARVPFGAPLCIAGGTAALVIAARKRYASAFARISTRTIVLAHALRAPIGASFLVALSHGALPAAFAVRAGVGDIVVGVGALVVGWATSRARSDSRVAAAWNVVGLIDILVAVATAQRAVLVEHDPLATRAIGSLPFGLLPTFIVPLVIGTHILLFMRFRDAAQRGTARHVA